MKSFFILGRNPQVSVAEILSYLEARNIEVVDWILDQNALILDTSQKLDLNRVMSSLGGSIAAGEMFVSGEEEEVFSFIENRDICPWTETKFDYTLVSFCEDGLTSAILDEMKRSFKSQKIKAMYKPAQGFVEMQNGEQTGGSPKKLLARDKVYFLFKSETVYFGLIKSIFDVDEAEKRDMSKPVRREALAISPRIARILINLAQMKEGQTVLDPFCGIGVLLHEAMLQGINAVGIDVDTNAIDGAQKNDKWLKAKYKLNTTSKLILGDSKKAYPGKVSGIATEPSLGQLLKHQVTQDQALMMAGRFENLMIGVLNNTKECLPKGGKIAFTSPLIQTNRGQVGCDRERIITATGLKMHELKYGKDLKFPIVETREGKVVSREIFVFEK